MKKLFSYNEVKWLEIGLVYITILTALDIPHFLQVKLNLPNIIFDRMFSVLLPLCIIMFFSLRKLYDKNNRPSVLAVKSEDIFFVVIILTWLSIEFAHYIDSSNPMAFSTILRYVWFYFLYVLLRELKFIRNSTNKIYWATLHVIAAISVLQLLSYSGFLSGLEYGFIPFLEKPNETHVNATSYIAVLGLWLYMSFGFFEDNRFSKFHIMYVFLYTFVLFINQSRGAILVFLMISFASIILSIKSKFIKIGLFILLSIASASFALHLLTSDVVLSHSSIDRFTTVDESANLRIVINELFIQEVIKSPMLGIGEYSASNIKYEGYSTHTHFMRILTYYGVISFMMHFVFMIILFKLHDYRGYRISVTAIVLVVGTQVFEPDLLWWYSIPVFFVLTYMDENFPNKHSTLVANYVKK